LKPQLKGKENSDKVKDFSGTVKNICLNRSFEELTISNQKATTPTGKNPVFLYEPAMFPNNLVKQVTGGKTWHELSPNTKRQVNQ
jgi:hypothetical protein